MSYKWWLMIAVALFGIGLAAGLLTPAGTNSISVEDMVALEEFFGFLRQVPPWALFILILVKNASVVLISFVFSPILCLVPVMALTFNGWVVGFVSSTVLQEEPLGQVLAGLLPHGVFEIPALIMGEAVALSFGTAVTLALFKKEGGQRLLSNLRRNLKYLIIACGLLLPAAIIETWVTPWLLH